ncbi:methionyl-tRNA formyltransferase [Sedimentisphaera salicampi]|uniref:Methionyl-tRNA formyltransferase n=1 Tax=Sedimentisphaera salicampi TaxID=1941349 RepID=A0A1W6LQF2_9BACT|nr:methionyl-tRNA formyltransferase [Sedimentisphaera salicampi]ARN58010.1 Methionyl-tRNA formyltransferase [Sedimentisphaera salicampi]OXU14175.1 Methionyl-tRNA formyltransferase [Sedimentisphaera salicampi]
MRIFFCGSSGFGLPCLEALRDSRHELVQVATQPAHKAGRGRKIRKTPAADWAEHNSVPCFETADINSDESLRLAETLRPDLFVVIAFGQKVGRDFIEKARYEAINVHASLLPKYRGAAPINWALLNGEKETGVTIITLAEKMDAGYMLGKKKTPIYKDDNAKSLHDRLAVLSPELLLETIDKIENGSASYIPQDETRATLARKLKKSDGIIDWHSSAEDIANKVRAFWPWPEAQTRYQIGKSGKIIKVIIADAEPAEKAEGSSQEVGALDDNMNVVCGEGALAINRLKPENSSMMDFKAFENGRYSGSDDKFLNIQPKYE